MPITRPKISRTRHSRRINQSNECDCAPSARPIPNSLVRRAPRVRKQAVDADATQEDGHDSEEAGEPGNQRLRGYGAIDLLFKAVHAIEKDV
jgi:hypothetical protein